LTDALAGAGANEFSIAASGIIIFHVIFSIIYVSFSHGYTSRNARGLVKEVPNVA
jgi:hypothetical protein